MEEKEIIKEDEFGVPSDKLTLLSGGLLYKDIPKVLDVAYMTTEDEELLFSNNLIDNGTVFNKLIEAKVKNDIKVEDLLIGDFNQILLFLRKTAYGNDYKVRVYDPHAESFVSKEVDLDKLEHVGLGEGYMENGEYEFILPLLKKKITFRLPTVGLGDIINKVAEKRKNPKTGVIPYLTTKLEYLITSIDGDDDPANITSLSKRMPPKDRLDFTKFMNSVEPKVDLNYKFISDHNGEEFDSDIVLSFDFFYPQDL